LSRKESKKIEEHYKFVIPALASPSSGETEFRHGNESLPCLRGMLSDTNAAAVRSAGCSWTAWKDAQDAGGFEMFAGRSRIGRPNVAVLMVRDAQCVRLPKAASICGASMRASESKEHWQLYICSAVPATWCGFGIMEVPSVRPRRQDFASNFTWKTTSKDAEDDE
jgi:hypothetical protein